MTSGARSKGPAPGQDGPEEQEGEPRGGSAIERGGEPSQENHWHGTGSG
jgi:hypothetical protein